MDFDIPFYNVENPIAYDNMSYQDELDAQNEADEAEFNREMNQ